MPECPKCGGEIELDDVVDELEAFIEFYKKCVGHCRKCGIIYQWIDIYDFNFRETTELKEV